MLWFSVICLLPFSVCSVWTVLLLLDGRRTGWSSGRKELCCFSAVCTVLYFCHAAYFLDPPTGLTWGNVLYSGANLAVYPLFFLYLRSVADLKGIRPADYLLLLPAIAVTIYATVVKTTGGPAENVLLCNKIMFPVLLVYVLIAGELLISGFNKAVRNFYAEAENKTMENLHLLFILLALTALASTAANFIGREAFSGRMLLAVPSVIFSTLLFLIMYTAHNLQFSAKDLLLDIERSNARINAVDETESKSSEIMERIDRIVSETKIYKQHGLSITDLAALVGTNRTYASNAINQQLGMSFSDYINRLRVEESKRILMSTEGKFVMSAVAEEAGFASEATFYRHFRNVEGKTPLEWFQALPENNQSE